MKIHQIQQEDNLYRAARNLRYALFFEEHNLPFSILDDEKESESTHVVISQGNTLIGYGRLTPLDETTFQISQMVIAPHHQSKGYGTLLLKNMVERATSSNARKIILNARTNATKLYSKLGFVIEGAIFPSRTTGVPHVRMTYGE